MDADSCFILEEQGRKRMPGEDGGAAQSSAHEKSEAEILEEMEKLGM